MANLILPDPRMEMPELFEPGRKPVGPVEIDWSHPLARGLKAAYLFQRSETDAPLVYEQRPDKNGTTVGFDPAIGAKFTSAGYLILEPSGLYFDMPDFTVVSAGVFPTPLYVSAVYSRWAASADSHLTVTTGRNLRFFSGSTRDSTDAFLADTYTQLAWRRDGANCLFNIDGVDDSGGAQTINANANASAQTTIGCNASNFGQQFAGNIYYLYVYSRALSERDLNDLYLSPYQFLIPA